MAAGYTVIEVLFVLALIAVIGSLALPQITTGMERARAHAAARYLAAQLALIRTQAVARGAAVAVRFEQQPTSWRMSTVLDGNGNGVRAMDVASGVDREIERLASLEEAFPGVSFGLASDPDADGIQLGGTTFLTFTPEGTSTSGSLYVLGRDGSQFAIRVLGATGRVRTQRLDPHTGSWVDAW